MNKQKQIMTKINIKKLLLVITISLVASYGFKAEAQIMTTSQQIQANANIVQMDRDRDINSNKALNDLVRLINQLNATQQAALAEEKAQNAKMQIIINKLSEQNAVLKNLLDLENEKNSEAQNTNLGRNNLAPIQNLNRVIPINTQNSKPAEIKYNPNLIKN